MSGHETQKSVSDWATATFGAAGSHARVAARANEEMAEILRAATSEPPNTEKIVEECADVVIVLYRLVERCGGDLLAAVDAKMAKNRGREWRRDGSGNGYHVPKAGARDAS